MDLNSNPALIDYSERWTGDRFATLIFGAAVFFLRVAADDLGRGTAVSCRHCSTAAASVATISRKRSRRPEWNCGLETASSSKHRFVSAIDRSAHPGVGPCRTILGMSATPSPAATMLVRIDVQGGGAETRSEPGLAADFLRPDAPRVGVVKSDLEEDLVREVAESHNGTAGERVFGSNHDHKRAAENFFGLKLLGTWEPG